MLGSVVSCISWWPMPGMGKCGKYCTWKLVAQAMISTSRRVPSAATSPSDVTFLMLLFTIQVTFGRVNASR